MLTQSTRLFRFIDLGLWVRIRFILIYFRARFYDVVIYGYLESPHLGYEFDETFEKKICCYTH